MKLKIGHWGHDDKDWGAVWESAQGLIPHLAWNQKQPPKPEFIEGLKISVSTGQLIVGSPVMLYTHNMFTWWKEGVGRLLNPFVSSDEMFQRGAGRFRGWRKEEIAAYLAGDDSAKDRPLQVDPKAQNIVNLLDILRVWLPETLIQADNFEGAGTETSLARARNAQGAFETRYPEMDPRGKGWTEMQHMSDDELRTVLNHNWRRMFSAYLDGVASIWPGKVQLITYGGPESVVSVGGHSSRFFVEPGAEPPVGEGPTTDATLLYQTVMNDESRYIPLASMYLHDWEAATLNGMAKNPLWRLMSWVSYSKCRGMIFWDGGIDNKAGQNNRRFSWCTPDIYASMVKACTLISLPELAMLYRDHGAAASDLDEGPEIKLDERDVEVENDLAATQALRELSSYPDFKIWWEYKSRMESRSGVHPGDRSRPVNFDGLPLWALEVRNIVTDEVLSWPTLPWGGSKEFWNPNWREWQNPEVFSKINAVARSMPAKNEGTLVWMHVMNLTQQEFLVCPKIDVDGNLSVDVQPVDLSLVSSANDQNLEGLLIPRNVALLAQSGVDVIAYFDDNWSLKDYWEVLDDDRASQYLIGSVSQPDPQDKILPELYDGRLLRLSPDVLLPAPNYLGSFIIPTEDQAKAVLLQVQGTYNLDPSQTGRLDVVIERSIYLQDSWHELPPLRIRQTYQAGTMPIDICELVQLGPDVKWRFDVKISGFNTSYGNVYVTRKEVKL